MTSEVAGTWIRTPRGTEPVLAAALLTLAPLAAAQAQTLEIGGLVEYQAIGYFSTPGELDRLGRNQLLVQPELELALGSRMAGLAALEGRVDGAREDRSRLYLREAYLDLFLDDFDLRAGRTILRWGRADALNPTDRFGTRDYTDLLDATEERVGQNALVVRWYPGAWNVEGILVPKLRASWLPADDGRWWPDMPDSVSVPGSGASRLPARYGYGEASWPTGGSARTAWGVRASTNTGGWDLSLSWYDGPSHLPAYAVRTRSDPASGGVDVLLERPYYRLRSLGADFATVLGGVGLHGEAAWTDPRADGRLPEGAAEPWLHWVVGGDYRVRNVLGERDLFLVAEWSKEVWPTGDYRPDPLDLTHAFRDALLGRAELSDGFFGSLEVEWAWDLADSGWLFRLARRWSPAAGLRARVSLDLPGGDRSSLFGTFRRNRRLHVEIRYER